MEIEVRRVDSQGRLSLPPKWRREQLRDAREVYVIGREGKLIIVPKLEADLTEYFDKVEVDISPESFEDYHRMKKALLREGQCAS